MSSSASGGKNLGFGSAADQRVFDLEIADRMDRLGAADGVRSHLRQADGANVPGLHQVGDRADGVFDRNRRIEPSRPIDVDVVDAEAVSVYARKFLIAAGRASMPSQLPSGARNAPNFTDSSACVAAIPQRAADQQLVVPGAVVVAGIEQRDRRRRGPRESWRCSRARPPARTCPTCPCSRGPTETPPVPPHPAFASRPPWGQISIFYIPPAEIENRDLTPPRVARL